MLVPSLSSKALHTRYPDKHFLSNEHSAFWRQLHSFMSVGVGSFSKLVLWFRMTLAKFGTQLVILRLFLLNNLWYLWCRGKCLSMSLRNILPMLVFTLILYGGLNHIFFLLRFLLGGGVDVNWIFSFKPLILSALLYAVQLYLSILYHKIHQIFFCWPSMVFFWR